MIDFKKEITDYLNEKIDSLEWDEINSMIEIPPKEMGDFAFPCFKLARTFRKAPHIIAQDLVSSMEGISIFEKVEAVGAYINFFIDKSTFAKSVIEEVLSLKEKFGSSDMGANKNVIVEFSSVNIAKPFHIGHIRSTVIGHALYNIYKFLGYNAISINHLGDYGTQFGKLIV